MQSPGQLMPVPVIVPVPVPVGGVTVRVRWGGGAAVNEPETALFAFIVRLQGPVPVQSPLHPAKLEPPVGLALSVTAVPSA